MSPSRLVVAVVMMGAAACRPASAQPRSALGLAVTVNDGISETVYRGWPLLLRGDAVLMENVPEPIVLELSSLSLAIAPARGPAQRWPLRRVTEFTAAPVLGPGNTGVRVVWLMTGEQTTALAPGAYTVRLAWAGRTSAPVALEIADPPATLPRGDEVRRALLQSQTAQALGDTAGALAALEPALTREPESIELLVQRARVHVQRGEGADAMQATQRALTIFHRDDPNAPHPPASILEVQSKARAALLKNAVPGPRLPGLPGGPPRTVATPPAPRVPGATPATPPTTVASSSALPLPAPTSTLPTTATQTAPATRIGAASPGVLVAAAELNDASIRADAAGQWSSSARAGSEYGRTQYSAMQATGAPNVPVVGNSPDAWCPAVRDQGMDWLEVTFAKSAHATEVRVRQSDTSGAIVKVEAFEADGTAHVWWEGVDPAKPAAVREIVWFAVRVPKTTYLVARVRLTLNLASGPGYKQIDAVQLVGAAL